MPLLAYLMNVDVRDLDEQTASFAVIAAASVLVSWVLIKLWRGFRFPCLVAAVIAATVILFEVRNTQAFHEGAPAGVLPLSYLIFGYVLGITAPLAVGILVFRSRQGIRTVQQAT